MYIPHSEEERRDILSFLGLETLEDLFSHIDPSLLSKPKLPEPKSEEELRRYFGKASRVNRELLCLAGFGAYDRIIPSALWQLLNRGEFLTAYTPYQPEASQGTLQALFEYQSLICELTGMEVANASLYDGASALAEGILMARAIKDKGKRVVLSRGVNPLYARVVETYLLGYGDEIVYCPIDQDGHTDLNRLEELLKDGQTHAIGVQYPNFLGYLEPLEDIAKLKNMYEVPLVVVADPIALSVLKPPGDFDADVVVGEGQQMGLPLNFGGPYAGFFATRERYVRKMPGRIVGLGEDIEGKRAFTLILQAREQHIRRERATSNICTNQNLTALANLLYMVLLGKEGLREVALHSLSKAMYMKRELLRMGFSEVFAGKHLWEFPVKHPNMEDLHKTLLREGILFGVLLKNFGYKDTTLLAVTEKRTRDELDGLLKKIASLKVA
ncbi:MAG: aminomethyl-transferring glycine dehydrogenase subunit GcvPA [Acidobacteria bacterium]|jgi:glycine dehydrogenase subunit 1|nr:MAG: aminomethyl-transferring glycine dehydrogenase subunit GcvPA [Acidobacteriota bacterium]